MGVLVKVWGSAVVGAVVVGVVVAGAPVVVAAPPESSAVVVADTDLATGDTFTVVQELYNPADFTVTDAYASIGGLADVVDLVSCTGALAPCSAYFTSFRGYAGDLAAGEGRTVTWTFRVRADALPGTVDWSHQFTGGNYAFEPAPGPALDISGTSADIGLRLAAAPRGLLAPRLAYTITVRNDGPGAATGVRVAGSYAAGLGWAGSDDCARVPGTRNLTCEVGALAAGQSRTLRFSASTGLLALGGFTTTVERVASTPGDPAPGNDRAARTCTALTGLVVVC